MRQREAVVMGGGVAGMPAALLLARQGHRVTLVERDDFAVGAALDSPGWRRKGIPHFLQPHAFIPRGRKVLAEQLPDVYGALLATGVDEVEVFRKIPGTRAPGDEEIRYLGVRRPLIEWALRAAVRAEPRITVLAGAHVDGLSVEGGRVAGVMIDGSMVPAELVVDALGRRTPAPGWVAASGVDGEPPRTSDCLVVYYSRYYRLRPGRVLPDGPWFLSPRGDLGYFGYASFPGDNGTFAALLAVPPGVPEWRSFKDPEAFEATVALIPALRGWVDPAAVEPITGVLTMAGLGNSLRSYDPAAAVGYVPVGDAWCHTDPVLAHGMSFALVHAAGLAAALGEHEELADACAAYAAAAAPELRERYELSTALDDQRYRLWCGEPVDLAHRDGAYALFSIFTAAVTGMADGDIARMFNRRIGLLDSTAVLDDDVEMQMRIEQVFDDVIAARGRPPGPSRDDVLAAISA